MIIQIDLKFHTVNYPIHIILPGIQFHTVDHPIQCSSLIRVMRLVNHHWCDCATKATWSLCLCYGCDVVEWMKMATENFTNLRHLDCGYCTEVTDQILGNLTAFSRLQDVKVDFSTSITDRGLLQLGNVTTLKQLTLGDCSGICGTTLGTLSSLTSICMRQCVRLTDQGLGCLGTLTSLVELRLMSCPQISNHGFDCLSALTGLTTLGFTLCSATTDEGFRFLSNLRSLQTLDLSYTRITDTVLRFSPLSSLVRLSLCGCYGIAESGTASLQKLDRIARLNLSRCGAVADPLLGFFGSLTALTSLCLSGCQIMDAGCRLLAASTSLVELDVWGCRGGSTDGLRSLRELSNLQRLREWDHSPILCDYPLACFSCFSDSDLDSD